MSRQIDRLLERLQEATTRLNAARDTVSQIIADANEKLVAANFGEEVTAKEDLSYLREDGSTSTTRLSYAKTSDGWQLCVTEPGSFEPDNTPLSDQSLQIRAAAVKQLPRFLQALIARAENQGKLLEDSLAEPPCEPGSDPRSAPKTGTAEVKGNRRAASTGGGFGRGVVESRDDEIPF